MRKTIVFAMENARAGRHDLDFAWLDFTSRSERILMLKFAFGNNGDDFHVVVRVASKASAALDSVIIEDTQRAKLEPFRVIPAGEGEGMFGVQPAVVGCAARGFGVEDGFHEFGLDVI